MFPRRRGALGLPSKACGEPTGCSASPKSMTRRSSRHLAEVIAVQPEPRNEAIRLGPLTDFYSVHIGKSRKRKSPVRQQGFSLNNLEGEGSRSGQ